MQQVALSTLRTAMRPDSRSSKVARHKVVDRDPWESEHPEASRTRRVRTQVEETGAAPRGNNSIAMRSLLQ
jgi:hypothetical protein